MELAHIETIPTHSGSSTTETDQPQYNFKMKTFLRLTIQPVVVTLLTLTCVSQLITGVSVVYFFQEINPSGIHLGAVILGGVMIHPKDVQSLNMSLRTIHPYGHNILVSLCPMSKMSHGCYVPKLNVPISRSLCPRFFFYNGHNIPVFSGTVCPQKIC